MPTSTAAFLGETERGTDRAALVTSYKDYQRWFGGVFGDTKFMPYAVNGFFENGGKRMFVCRVVGAERAAHASASSATSRVEAVGPAPGAMRVYAKIDDSTTTPGRRLARLAWFRLRLAYCAATARRQGIFDPFATRPLPRPRSPRTFDDLVDDESSPDFYEEAGLRNQSSALADHVRAQRRRSAIRRCSRRASVLALERRQ